MKRMILLAAIAATPSVALIGGCEDSGSSSMKMNSPWKKTGPAAAPAKPNYFEVKRNGKTYVLGSTDSLAAFNNDKPVKLAEMPKYGPDGDTVVFEDSDYTQHNRLIAEYRKAHGM